MLYSNITRRPGLDRNAVGKLEEFIQHLCICFPYLKWE